MYVCIPYSVQPNRPNLPAAPYGVIGTKGEQIGDCDWLGSGTALARCRKSSISPGRSVTLAAHLWIGGILETGSNAWRDGRIQEVYDTIDRCLY
jgi:hypothetical protein